MTTFNAPFAPSYRRGFALGVCFAQQPQGECLPFAAALCLDLPPFSRASPFNWTAA